MRGLKIKSLDLLMLFLLVLIKPILLNNLKSSSININVKYQDDLNIIPRQDNYLYGRILYQNPYKFNEELIIATDDNLINLNDYVLNEKGLIGIIKNKYHNMAIVQLLTSKDILLQIQINNCYGLFKNNQVDNIDTHCLIKQGDEVYTSNLGYTDTLILIGHIKTIIDNQNEISNSYLISLVNNEVLSRDVVILRSK